MGFLPWPRYVAKAHPGEELFLLPREEKKSQVPGTDMEL
jgi:hypothetical protein